MTGRKPTPPGAGGRPRVNSNKVSLIDVQSDPWLAQEPVRSTGSVVAFPTPRRNHRRRNVVLSLIALVALMTGVLAYLVFSPALALREVSVTGNTLVTAEEATAALDPLLGTPLPQVADDEVEELLAGFAPIESVTVAAVPPSGLAVTIRERTPVAILQSNNQFLLIDEEGRQLTTVQDRGAVQLPLIDGGAEAVNSQVFSSIAAVLAALPESILNQLDHASAGSVDSVELSLTSGQTIFWGSAEENQAKALVIEALLAAPPADPPAEVFDVSTPSSPVTR